MSLYVGARSPESVALTITRGTGDDLDLTTVVSVDLETVATNGTVSEWAWTLGAATTTSLVVSHELAADGSDIPRAGRYTIRGWLVTASSRRRITPVHLTAAEYT